MGRQRRQTVLLAVTVSVCHLLLLAAMQWLWQPRSRIDRLPVPVFARMLTPQPPRSMNYSVEAQPDAATGSESPAEGASDGGRAEQQQGAAENAENAENAEKAEGEAGGAADALRPPQQQVAAPPVAPARRRQLWAPLPPDEKPVFRQTQRQPVPQAEVVQTQEPQTEQTEQTANAPQGDTQVAATTPQPAATAAPQMAAATAVPTGKAASPAATESVVLTNPMDAWPPSTRLRYAVGGNYRGKVSGSAQVQWVRQDTRYQSQVDMDFGLIPGVQMVSQGRIFPTGLQPGVFEEKQGVGGWRSVSFNINSITVHDGRTVKNPDQRVGQMLDPAAQFVEFSHRFRTGTLPLKAGTVFDFWLGRPEAIYRWQYSISGPMLLELPQYGDVVVHHIRPTPLSLQGRGSTGYVVEMWYAPELQFLPVRIRLNMGTEGHIDLLLNSVEQSAEPPSAG